MAQNINAHNEVVLLRGGLYRRKISCLHCHTTQYMKLYVHEVGNIVTNTWFQCSNCNCSYAFPRQSHFLECPQCDGKGMMWNFSREEMLVEAKPYAKVRIKVPCNLCFGRKWARIRLGEIR